MQRFLAERFRFAFQHNQLFTASFSRWFMAIGISLGAHIGLVPLLAIYGVHICPVLHDQGFTFGCKFNLAWVLVSLLVSTAANAGIFFVLYNNTLRPHKVSRLPQFSLRDFSWISGSIHFLVFICGIFFLLDYLEPFDLPNPTTIRMTAAFAISAIFLSMLQTECLDWAIQYWLRTNEKWQNFFSPEAGQDNASKFYKTWVKSLLSRNAPFWAGILVVIVYGYSKVLEIKEMYDVDDDFFNSRINEALKIMALTLGWLLLVDTIKFRKESDLVKDIHDHVDALARGKTDYYSREVASGIWQELFQILNSTTKALTHKSRLIKGLSAYATSQVIDKVLHKEELQTFGQRKTIAILMSDLRGFTEFSNALEPEKVVLLLNMYFEAMISVCAEYELVVDKFIGDGLLAYADPETGNANEQCQRCVRAADAMLVALSELNEKIADLGHKPLRIGIGLHYGDVIVGSIGSKSRLQHTIIGDAVNTAARLEAKCKDLNAVVVASKAIVCKTTPTDFSALLHHGAVEIRGLAQSIEVYTVDKSYTPAKQNKSA